MKSSKQRRAEIKAERAEKREKLSAKARAAARAGEVLVNPSLLRPSNSYDIPEFVRRGYYTEFPFLCKDCGKEEVWSPTQQKWWYEVAKGNVFTVAVRCRSCRRREKERKTKARQVSIEGRARKQGTKHNL